MTRRSKMKVRIKHSPIRQAHRAKKRHESIRPQEYKKDRLNAEQILALFSPTKRAELKQKKLEEQLSAALGEEFVDAGSE
jgi:hypothetical protein